MTRISLKESYDDRTVIVKLARIEDTANDCKDASEKAVTSAQTAEASAKESLGACNVAKASAEQSAKDAKTSADVVASYDARLNDKVSKTGDATPQVISGTGGIQVQGDVSVGGDLTVAESGSVHMDGSDMEIAGMAVEKSGTTTVLSNETGGVKVVGGLAVPDTPTGSKTTDAVNGRRLQADLDAYAPMVRTTGSQTISGVKSFESGVIGQWGGWYDVSRGLTTAKGSSIVFAKILPRSNGGYHYFELTQCSNTAPCYGKFMLRENIDYPYPTWLTRKVSSGPHNCIPTASAISVGVKDGALWLIWNKPSEYGNLMCRQSLETDYSLVRSLSVSSVEWVMPSVIDTADFTIIEVSE